MVKISHGLVLAAALMPVALQAAVGDSSVVDDFEAGTNQNKFLAYSFFYDDSKDSGNTVVSSATPGAPGELVFDPTLSVGEGANGSTKSAKLAFTYGNKKPSCGTGCTYGNMAGFGTGFIEEPKDGSVASLDMTGASSITFMAKADKAMVMRVEIATAPVLDFGYHLFQASLTTTWQTFTIPLVEGIGFAQPAWADPVVFDVTKMQKIQFAISADDNTGLTGGVVNIDNIVVHGYKWVPPAACMTCVGLPQTGASLSNMETAPKNQNAAGGYWFAYNDAEGRTVATQTEYSEIFGGVVFDPLTPTIPTLTISEAKGAAASAGAFIEFALGPTFLEGVETIKPFVGVGTKVSDALDVNFSDFSSGSGIGFSYWTKAGSTFDFIRFEAISNQDFGNAGAVYSVLLPSTAGEWKTAVVKFTDLKLPTWESVTPAPLAKATMAKFQWAVQNEPGTTGAIAIDNVTCEGMVACPTIGGAPIRNSFASKARAFSVSRGLNGLQVAVRLNESQTKATVRVVDVKGQLAAKEEITGRDTQIANISQDKLKSGVYSVQVTLGDKVLPAAMTVIP